MKRYREMNSTILIGLVMLAMSGCVDRGANPLPPPQQLPDPQEVRIDFQYGFRDTVDTFRGYLTKDLVLDGTVTIPFWLTTTEQQRILEALERYDFFELPETLAAVPGSALDPNPGPDFLRVRVDGRDKAVVWFYPLPDMDTAAASIESLAVAIRRIVEAKAEYQRLPSANGGYDTFLYTLTLPTNVFPLLDTLRGTFEVLNRSVNPRRFRFAYVEQFGFVLLDNAQVPAMGYPYTVSAALSEFTLQPGERKVFVLCSPFRNFSGNLIGRGDYTLEAYLRESNSPGVYLPVKVE